MSASSIEPAALGLPGRQPLELWGAWPPAPRIAVVGSRAMSGRHAQCTRAWVAAAAARGFSLVSGGARGIDITAHRAALELGMPQAVVLPSAPEWIYPPEHRTEFETIARARDSGVLFGAPPGTPAARGLFASRNRLVVAASVAVVVVQARRRSGSMGTGRLALRRGLPVAVCLGSEGAEALVAEGAFSVGHASDLEDARLDPWLSAVARGETPVAPSDVWPQHLGWLSDALRDAPPLGRPLESMGPALPAMCALTEAIDLGLVVECAPGRYRRA